MNVSMYVHVYLPEIIHLMIHTGNAIYIYFQYSSHLLELLSGEIWLYLKCICRHFAIQIKLALVSLCIQLDKQVWSMAGGN